MRKLLFPLALLLLLTLYLSGVKAHDISVVTLPKTVVIDVGDALRWAANNPDANLPDITIRITFVARNVSSTTLTLAPTISASDPLVTNITCDSALVGSGKTVSVGCTIELNVFEGNTKAFEGPEKVIPLETNVVLLQGSSVRNWYRKEVNIVLIDTSDPAWTLVKEWNTENGDTIEINKDLVEVGTDLLNGTVYAMPSQFTTLSPLWTGSACRYNKCYRVAGTGEKGVVRFSVGQDLSAYQECYLVGYLNVYASDVYTLDPSSQTVGYESFLGHFSQGSSSTFVQLTAPVDKTSGTAAFYFSVSGYSGSIFLDDPRVYCR